MAKDAGDIRKARLLAQKALIEDPDLEQAKALIEEMEEDSPLIFSATRALKYNVTLLHHIP